jgi:hypothetical protein
MGLTRRMEATGRQVVDVRLSRTNSVHGMNLDCSRVRITEGASDLSSLPQQTVKATDYGTTAGFEGVLLTGVFAEAYLPAGERSRGTAYYLLMEAELMGASGDGARRRTGEVKRLRSPRRHRKRASHSPGGVPGGGFAQ